MSYCTIALAATAVVAVVGLVSWLIYAKRIKYDRRRAVGNIVWLVHVFVFDVAALILDPQTLGPSLQTWCAAVKLHGVIQVAADGLYTLIRWIKLQQLVRRALHE